MSDGQSCKEKCEDCGCDHHPALECQVRVSRKEFVLACELDKVKREIHELNRDGFQYQGVGSDKAVETEAIRRFASGATRDSDEGKLDFDGFFSPDVMFRYAEYMHVNRIQSDGTVRASDNWKKSIPLDQYMKSMWRHFMEVWTIHQNEKEEADIETSLCALKFNVDGMLHEILKRSQIENDRS